MLRWLVIALIGILVSLYATSTLHLSFKMPATFDHTNVDHDTVLTPTLSMLGGQQSHAPSSFLNQPS